jgi:peptidoglycan pentaglycine glycine transferase (the first glycine)
MQGLEWDSIISHLPGAHILQTWEWAKIKESYGWKMLPQVWKDDSGTVRAAAMVLQRTISPGGFAARLRILYVPRGPLLDWSDPIWRVRVLEDLKILARKQRAIFIKIDPEMVIGTGIPGAEDVQESGIGPQVLADLKTGIWRYSSEQIQFKNSVWLDLTLSEKELLGKMKQKARYNLRLAERRGVQVLQGNLSDLPMLYRMYAETSIRDGFVIRPEAYYLQVWQNFIARGKAEVLLATVDGQVVSALLLFFFAGKAWYLYGMSSDVHRDKMPNQLLQWKAICRAKELGCSSYDLWGAPDVFNESDSMWGVFRFKEGLGGRVVRTLGAWDYPNQRCMYWIYTSLLPRVMNVLRWRGKQKIRREVSL